MAASSSTSLSWERRSLLLPRLSRVLASAMVSATDGALFSFRARQILISNGQQTLGVALPWGIASGRVRPHEKTLSISGDGGFLFSAMELETGCPIEA
jgi:thiamine pyrophosphate-dependent acetolactate synthase large subunit-like protein